MEKSRLANELLNRAGSLFGDIDHLACSLPEGTVQHELALWVVEQAKYLNKKCNYIYLTSADIEKMEKICAELEIYQSVLEALVGINKEWFKKEINN